jgi:hypothetical protein
MNRLRLAVMGSVALFLAAGWLLGQDNKSTSNDTQPSPTKAKGTLPPYFKALGLTDDQHQKVVRIHSGYKSKIDSLTEQIAQLRNEERAELNKVLSDTQRIRLRELRSHESEPVKESVPNDKAPIDKKVDPK